MSSNRIDCCCWYREYDAKTRKHTDWKIGIVLAWSVDHEEYENGPGHFPCAVIEDLETKCMKSVHVQLVRFSAPED